MYKDIKIRYSRDFAHYKNVVLVPGDSNAYRIVFETPWTLDGCKFKVSCQRSDGETVTDFGEVSGKTATYVIASSMYALPGEAVFRLTLTQDDGTVFTVCEVYAEVALGAGGSGESLTPVIDGILTSVSGINDKLTALETQVSDDHTTLTELTQKISQLLAEKTEIAIPEGVLSADYAVKVYEKGNEYSAEKAPADFWTYTSANTYYVDYKTGSSSNDGLSRQKPLKYPSDASSKASDGDTIVLLGSNHYPRNRMPFSSGKSLKVVADDGATAVMCNADNSLDLKWALVDGYENLYQVTRSTTYAVYDFSAGSGNPHALTLANSMSACAETADTYFVDGNVVYVHTSDGRKPDYDIMACINACGADIANGQTVYCKGIDFMFGSSACRVKAVTGKQPMFLGESCTFSYSKTNGLSSMGAKFVYLKDCTAHNNFSDGLSYHAELGYTSEAIEVNCKGCKNGTSADDKDNGSTIHDGCKILRICGEYYQNKGPNVADANTASVSCNIACSAHNSAADADLRKIDYQIQDGTMYLYKCKAEASPISVYVQKSADDGAPTLYKHESTLPNTNSVTDGATVKTF